MQTLSKTQEQHYSMRNHFANSGFIPPISYLRKQPVLGWYW